MTDEPVTNCNDLKPLRCGCGGDVAVLFGVNKGHEYYIVKCWGCGTQTVKKRHKAEAIEAWNRAMGGKPERKKGKWVKVGHFGRSYKCDQCGNFLDFDGVNVGRGDANFCPNCGADMRGE